MNLKEIEDLKLKLENELNNAENINNLENFRLRYLSRKGEINDLFEQLKSLSIEEKRIIGPKLNDFKRSIDGLFEEKRKKFEIKNENSFFDYTLPGFKKEIGSLHPTTLTLRHMLKVFDAFGFEIVEANEIESEYYNFDSLNVEKDHPARDM